MRIAIFHRDRLYRESLSACLQQVETFSIVHSASRLELGDEATLLCKPDLLILEFGLSRRAGMIDASGVRPPCLAVKTIVIGVPNTEEDIFECIEADGASGYLLMDASLDDLTNNIKAIMRGETVCSPRIASLAFYRMSKLAHQIEDVRGGTGTSLTRREMEIVILIDDGLSNKEIAVRLHIEVSTVKNHVHNLLYKLQQQDRHSAVKYVKAQGLIAGRR